MGLIFAESSIPSNPGDSEKAAFAEAKGDSRDGPHFAGKGLQSEAEADTHGDFSGWVAVEWMRSSDNIGDLTEELGVPD
jgi:hypothetical protein